MSHWDNLTAISSQREQIFPTVLVLQPYRTVFEPTIPPEQRQELMATTLQSVRVNNTKLKGYGPNLVAVFGISFYPYSSPLRVAN